MDEIVEFIIPLRNEDLEEEHADKYYVQNVLELASAGNSIIQNCMNELEESIEEKAYSIHKHENFDTMYSILKHFSVLQESSTFHVIEILISGLSSLLRSISMLMRDENNTMEDNFETALKIHRNALKMYVYLIQWCVSLLERSEHEEAVAKAAKKNGRAKGRKKDTIGIDSWKERMIKVLTSILDHDLGRLWRAEKAEDAFLLLFFNTAYCMLENPENTKSKSTTTSVFQLINTALSATDNMQGAVSAIVNMILKYEHIADTVVELLEYMVEESSNRPDPQNSNSNQFINELFIEIGKLENEDLNMDKTGTTHLSNFITIMGDRMPRNVLHNLSVMITHLNDESYTMRNAIVHALSRVVSQILCKDNSEMVTKVRDDLLGILLERFRDTNAYTRSKVIQCWSYLCEEKALPLKTVPEIIALVKGRLHDKSAFVRKAAVQFLSNLLDNNPYATPDCGLRREFFIEELRKVEEELASDKITQSLMKKNLAQKGWLTEALRAIDQLEETIPLACELLYTTTSSDVTECIEFLARTYLSQIDNSEKGVRNMMKLVWSREQSVKDAVMNAFEQLFLAQDKYSSPEACIKMARKLIILARSCNLQEVTALEAIITLTIQQDMFPKHLLLALFELFILSDQVPDPTDEDCSGAALLLRMVANARPAQIRKRIKTLIKHGLGSKAEGHPYLVLYTCDIFERLAIDDSTTAEVKKKQDDDILGYIGGEANFRLPPGHPVFNHLVRLLCGNYYSMNHWVPVADRALRCIFALCERPVEVSYRIINLLTRRVNTSESSETEGVDKSESFPEHDKMNGDVPMTVQPVSSVVNVSIPDLTKLLFILGHSALKELVHIEAQHKKAKKLRQVAQLEADAEKEKKSKGKGKPKKKSRRKKTQESESSDDEEDAEQVRKNKKSAIEEELGLDPNNLEDHELDETFEEKERQILGPDSIYTRYIPLIHAVCQDYHRKIYTDTQLRTHAIFALCKFMNVSLDFCEQNLQLLFTLLLHENSAKVNLVVTIGDLACRFPNSVEPWTHHLYRCLRDTDRNVRKQTLMVLSHLVLNDMVKVKSNISDIVRLIEDYDGEIARLAKSFFTELARKGSGNNNPIYNLLPDVLSRLSAENIAQESFRNIMKFMLSFVTKDRHNEKLVEKLCQRFKAITINCFLPSTSAETVTTDTLENQTVTAQKELDTDLISKTNPINQWRDIAYCLTLLPSFNDKCVKKLIECIKEYQHALADEEVFNTIRTLGTKKQATSEKTKAKSVAGNDSFKQAVEDWEKKLVELHAKLSDEFNYEQHVVEATSRRRKRGRNQKEKTKTPAKSGRGKRRRVQEESEEEISDLEFDDDDEEETAEDDNQEEQNEGEESDDEKEQASSPKIVMAKTSGKPRAKRARMSDHEEENGEAPDSLDQTQNEDQMQDDDEEPAPTVIKSRKTVTRRRRRVVN